MKKYREIRFTFYEERFTSYLSLNCDYLIMIYLCQKLPVQFYLSNHSSASPRQKRIVKELSICQVKKRPPKRYICVHAQCLPRSKIVINRTFRTKIEKMRIFSIFQLNSFEILATIAYLAHVLLLSLFR